jgi:RimJ/RimL family protein N-acetyltransferase
MHEAAPERLDTERLVLRRPAAADAQAIFERYATDPQVTRFLVWPTHRSIEDTRAFIAFSDDEWQRHGVGPYLALSRETGDVIGGTGLARETRYRAATGYVLARDAWGHGLALEALQAMVEVAPSIGIRRLYALCHPDHVRSRRVLEKAAFVLEGVLGRYAEFPNLKPGEPCDVRCYARVF